MPYLSLRGLGSLNGALSTSLALNPTLLDEDIKKNPEIIWVLKETDPKSYMHIMTGSQVAKDVYKARIEEEERVAAQRVADAQVYYPELNVPNLKLSAPPKLPARTWEEQRQQSEISDALNLLDAQYKQSLNNSMSNALNNMSIGLQEAAMKASMVRLGLDLTMKALPIAAWVGESINAILDTFGSKYQSDAQAILEDARKQALAKQSASTARVRQMFTEVVKREKPYAIAIALHDLGLPVERPPSELGDFFGDVWDKLKDFGRKFEATFIRPVAHAARSYIGGRIVKEKAREEARKILNTVEQKLSQHESNVQELTDSIGFRLAVREELANIAKQSPEVKTVANKYHQAVQYVKSVVASKMLEEQKKQQRAETQETVKKLGKPLLIGGAILAAAVLMD